MPRPVQHPRQAPRGTAGNVACRPLLPLSTSGKHVPVTAGAQVPLGRGREAARPRCCHAGIGRFPGLMAPAALTWLGQGQGNTGRSGPGRTLAGPGGRLAMGDVLTIGARHEPGYAIVTVGGEIDIATVTQFREGLVKMAISGQPLVADLDRVSFIDSAGLSALVGAANRAAAYGSSLHVVCAQPKIRQLFRLTGLDHRIPLARTLDEARQALAARTTPP